MSIGAGYSRVWKINLLGRHAARDHLVPDGFEKFCDWVFSADVDPGLNGTRPRRSGVSTLRGENRLARERTEHTRLFT